MKLAAAHGAVWLFGSIIGIYFIFNASFVERSAYEQMAILTFIGIVFGGLGFGIKLRDTLEEDRKHELRKRRLDPHE